MLRPPPPGWPARRSPPARSAPAAPPDDRARVPRRPPGRRAPAGSCPHALGDPDDDALAPLPRDHLERPVGAVERGQAGLEIVEAVAGSAILQREGGAVVPDG